MIFDQYSHASTEHPERCDDAVLIARNTGAAPVFAVIDGLGGHQHTLPDGRVLTGQDASRLVQAALSTELAALPSAIEAEPGGAAERRIINTLAQLDGQIYREFNGDALALPNRIGAVLTVAVVCEAGRRLLTVQVGDTRAYLYSGGELIQVCMDEDNIEYLIRKRVISAEDGARISAVLNRYDGTQEPQVDGTVSIAGQVYELYLAWRWFKFGNPALGIPPANVVITALGMGSTDLVPQTSRIEIAPGDVLCLCSDGLYNNLTDDEIASMLEGSGDLARQLGEAALARSADRANRRSTPDDISVIVVRF